MTQSAYVKSNYKRKKDDDYKTIDERCVLALIDTIKLFGDIVDCCSPTGSGIVDTLNEYGYFAKEVGDAFGEFDSDWVISNPPYKKGLVDKIINAQIDRIGNIEGVCMLLRNNFDFAKSRWDMFANNRYYHGQIHMLFRPWWDEEHKAAPIHNFVWHIWRRGEIKEPVVYYWRENE